MVQAVDKNFRNCYNKTQCNLSEIRHITSEINFQQLFTLWSRTITLFSVHLAGFAIASFPGVSEHYLHTKLYDYSPL
jgi:hypothetical protein